LSAELRSSDAEERACNDTPHCGVPTTEGGAHRSAPHDQPAAFLDALIATQRAPELADVDDLFDFLIGSWDLEAVLYDANGLTQKGSGGRRVAWVREGRAIQDLSIYPRRADRARGVPAQGDRSATTIRTYDGTLGAWGVEFINPAA